MVSLHPGDFYEPIPQFRRLVFHIFPVFTPHHLFIGNVKRYNSYHFFAYESLLGKYAIQVAYGVNLGKVAVGKLVLLKALVSYQTQRHLW